MAIKHGRERYRRGCRCDECRDAQAAYQRVYRERQRNDLPASTNVDPDPNGLPGPVELAVEAELAGLVSAELRPGLVAIVVCMARVLDSAASTPKPAAAKVLVSALDALHKASAQGRRGRLALVKEMTTKDGA